mgnify:CR=1 FL=1
MSLINCPTCKKSVAGDAVTCPHCGKKLRTPFSIWRVVGLLLLVLIVGLMFGQ